jgi:nitroreductase
MTCLAPEDSTQHADGPLDRSGPAEDRHPRLDVLEQIARSRRSVYAYLDTPVPRRWVERAFRLALLAPNHHKTNPWRFFAFSGSGRARLVKAYESAASRLGKDVARARQRALDAPLMIVVACIPSTANPRVKANEETFATAAAVQTLLLALAAAGVSTLITTGDLVESTEVGALVGVDPQAGAVLAVISAGFGDPARRVVPRPEPDLERWVTWFEEPEPRAAGSP